MLFGDDDIALFDRADYESGGEAGELAGREPGDVLEPPQFSDSRGSLTQPLSKRYQTDSRVWF